MLTEAQIEARKEGIGGSDVAAILGLSPWKSQYQLYLEKRGEWVEPPKESEIIHFGNVLEDVVAQEYARRNKVKVQRRNDQFKHKEIPYLLANVDRKVVGSRKGLECKTTDKYMRGNWGESGTDQVPEYYLVQEQHYMTVLDYPEWDLAVLIGGNEYREYELEHDDELAGMMVEACKTFWQRVQEGIPPEIDFAHRETMNVLKQMYPGTNGETITLPEELVKWHQVKVEADAEVKRYTAVSDACKARILAHMKDNAIGIVPGCDFQYKRSVVKKKQYVVEATEYSTMRGSKYTPPKGEQ